MPTSHLECQLASELAHAWVDIGPFLFSSPVHVIQRCAGEGDLQAVPDRHTQ